MPARVSRARQRSWWGVALIVLTLVLPLRWSGYLTPLEHFVTDQRFSWLAREVASDTVIVGIDPRSLAALNHWPWPRAHHAQLLHILEEARPASVFFDVDFSAVSTPADDALFEQALSRWSHQPVKLPVHHQPASGADATLLVREPLERFARHAQLVSIMLEPGRDGLVRGTRSSWDMGGRHVRSPAAHHGAAPDDTWIKLDLSIVPSSFGYVSYVDLLSGAVEAHELTGKDVYIGATALELRDVVPVPVHRSLPGVVVLALAVESARKGLIEPVPEWLYVLLLAGFIGAAARLCHGRGWRRNGALLAMALAAAFAAALWLFLRYRMELEIVPLAAAAAGVFFASTLRSLDRQRLLSVAYALGLKRRSALLRSVVEGSSDAIVCVDHEGRIRTANGAAARIFGRPHAEVLGSFLRELIPGLTPAAAPADVAAEYETVTGDGGMLPVEVTMSRVALEDVRLYTAIIRDISLRKAQQRKLQYQATHDQMTGLANRAALIDHLASALAAEPDARVALLMLGLGRFKEVNDTLGPETGDEVLEAIAGRLREMAAAEQLFVARTSADEFAVVVSRVRREADVERVAAKLMSALREPVQAAGIGIVLGGSIGAAMSSEDACDAYSLLKQAGVALHACRRRNRPFDYYQAEHHRQSMRRLRMLAELRAAIAADQLELHFQPQVDLRTGQVESVEALLRWPHSVFGAVQPAEFVGLAESSELIQPLTDWTLREALQQLRAWHGRDRALRVAVNVSARLLQDVKFPRRVREMLSRWDVPPPLLELEITESAMMHDIGGASRALQDLHAYGVSISVDDFGTGFSSLRYLRDLPVHTVKLDKSFVIGLDRRQDNRAIVDSTVSMAHALGLRVVAEGVETASVCRCLTEAGYDVGQGFWFARPMSGADCSEWLARREGDADRRRAG